MIGSIKGNIGHLEISAFLASLAKVCMIFETSTIPPNVNFRNPNPLIEWDRYRLRVPTESTPLVLSDPSKPALISITSSGIGGSNGHIVVEAPPARPQGSEDTVACKDPIVLVAGGLSPRSASASAQSLAQLVNSFTSDQIRALMPLLARRGRQMTWRSVAVYSPMEPVRFPDPIMVPRRAHPVVFVFCGQGPQHGRSKW